LQLAGGRAAVIVTVVPLTWQDPPVTLIAAVAPLLVVAVTLNVFP
jgi:hypothetical protein